jgi:N-acetylmuramoyl-L-alanine amidase
LLPSQVAPGGAPATPELQKQLTVYSPQASYSVLVVTREQMDYVGLLETLEPLGSVSAKLEGKKWKLHFGEHEAQFVAGKSLAKIHKSEVDLRSPFLIENGRGLVPVRILPQLLGQFLPGHALSWHESSRRLFLENTETHYTAGIKGGGNSQLIIAFSSPVNPAVSTEPGRLRLIFHRDALLPNGTAGVQNLGDKVIPSLAYSESNGSAELAVSGSVPLMAYFSGDHKTITIAPVTPPAPAPTTPASAPANIASPVPATAPAGPPLRNFLVVIDAGHGGDDRGAALSSDFSEKDAALSWARRLLGEFQTHGIPARMIREADVSLSPEQRAAAANLAVPSLYLAVHVTGSGAGVHLFTSPLPAIKPTAFLPWDSAQGAYVETSRVVANALATELLKRNIPALNRTSLVAPLNAIAAPALAVELAPPPKGAAAQLQSGSYQTAVCSAIAEVVAAVRGQLPRGERMR